MREVTYFRLGAGRRRAVARDELEQGPRGERLVERVLHREIELRFVPRSRHHDRRDLDPAGILALDLSQLRAGHHRHLDVEQDHPRRSAEQNVDRFESVRCGLDGISCTREHRREELAGIDVVVDDENIDRVLRVDSRAGRLMSM